MNKRMNLIKASLVLSVLVMLLGVSQAWAVKLPNVVIPAGETNGVPQHATSLPFTVSKTGKLTIDIKLRVNTPFGVPILGESQYTAKLIKMSAPNTVLEGEGVTATAVVTSTFKKVTLTYDIKDCNQTGSYAIRLYNSGTLNRQQGEAEFVEFFPPVLVPSTTGTLSQFGVTQGNDLIVDIPSQWEPTGTGGTFNIKATWMGICLDLINGCKLVFRLVRIKSDGTQETSLPTVAYSGKLNKNYEFTSAAQIDGNFKLKVSGDSTGNVQNVKVTVKYTPKCGQ